MDVKQAASKMFHDVIGDMPDVDDPNVSAQHLRWMSTQIMQGNVVGEKAHRWLGYMQGVVVTLGVGTLEDMKQLNKSCTGPGDREPNFEKVDIVDSALSVQHHRFTLGGRRHIWTCILWAPDLETNQPTVVGRGVALLNPVDLPNNGGKMSERIGRSMAYGRALKDLYDNKHKITRDGVNIRGIRWFPKKDEPQQEMIRIG